MPSFVLVRLARFELASFRRRILSPLCMPFHHSRNQFILPVRPCFVNLIRLKNASVRVQSPPINPPNGALVQRRASAAKPP